MIWVLFLLPFLGNLGYYTGLTWTQVTDVWVNLALAEKKKKDILRTCLKENVQGWFWLASGTAGSGIQEISWGPIFLHHFRSSLLCTGALPRVYVVTLNHSAITSLYSFKKPPVKGNISFPSKSHKEIAPLLAWLVSCDHSLTSHQSL